MPLPTLGDLIGAIVARYRGTPAVGPVVRTRDAAPAVSFTATTDLVADRNFAVKVVVGDVPGPATFSYSADDGTTWSDPAPIPEGGTAVLEPGLTASFSMPAAHQAYEAGDEYSAQAFSARPVTSIIGEQGEGDNTAPPRFVWVPTRDTFGAPNVIGPEPQGRSVMTRHAGLDCHVWAPAVAPLPEGVEQATANMRAAEQMLNDLLHSVHEELRAGTAPGGGTWWGRGCRYRVDSVAWQTKGTLMQNGCECICELVIDLPVLSPDFATVRPLKFSISEEIET